MINKILWTIDNELEGKVFERLCTDLLSREGYYDIIPLGGNYDNSRDAEIRKLKGKNEIDEITFFQYSLEKRWKLKLEKELAKAFKKHNTIHNYVFVTSSKVTGRNRDELKSKYLAKYKTNLIIYDREWLRNRLETSNYDLTKKYLGINENELSIPEDLVINLKISSTQKKEKHWFQYFRGNYETAIIFFKEHLLTEPKSPEVLIALSWSLYRVRNYDEALYYINIAIDIVGYNYNTKAIKACILAEEGIKKQSKEHLLIAKDLFHELAKKSKRAIDHYNFGNTLSALGEFDAAKKSYLRSLKLNSQRAETWKNLGGVYSHLGNYEEELNCYNKALKINPTLTQAIVSKAATLVRFLNSPLKAIRLFDQALSIDEKIPMLWEHFWFWYAEAQYKMKKNEEALISIKKGLELQPSHFAMLNLKANILSVLWRNNKGYIKEAIEFYNYRLKVFDNEIESVLELLEIFTYLNKPQNFWNMISAVLKYDNLNLKSYCNKKGIVYVLIDVLRCRELYEEHRLITPLKNYFELDNSKSITIDSKFVDILHLELSIPFGNLCKSFILYNGKSNKKTSLNKILNTFMMI